MPQTAYEVVWDGEKERAGDCPTIRGLEPEVYREPPPVTRPPQVGRTRPRQKKPAPTPALDGSKQRRLVRDVTLPPSAVRVHTGTPVAPRPDRSPKTSRRVGVLTTRDALKGARYKARRGLAAAQEAGDLAGAVQWADRLRELDRQFFGDDPDAYREKLRRVQVDQAASARLAKAGEYFGRALKAPRRRERRIGAVVRDWLTGVQFVVVWAGGPGLSQCRQTSHCWAVAERYCWAHFSG